MTSVIGHLTGLEFERQYKGWASCPPSVLFEAPVIEAVDAVSTRQRCGPSGADAIIGEAEHRRKYPGAGPILQSAVHLDRL
jgi:hypothetical protein